MRTCAAAGEPRNTPVTRNEEGATDETRTELVHERKSPSSRRRWAKFDALLTVVWEAVTVDYTVIMERPKGICNVVNISRQV